MDQQDHSVGGREGGREGGGEGREGGMEEERGGREGGRRGGREGGRGETMEGERMEQDDFSMHTPLSSSSE